MSDIVVTLPKSFTWAGAPGLKGLGAWLAEGDAAGEPRSGADYCWSIGAHAPRIEPGERVYVCYNGQLIGFAPLLHVQSTMAHAFDGKPRYLLVRGGGAECVTIPEFISGFRGYRYRWWERHNEVPIANWREMVREARAGRTVPMARAACPERSTQRATEGHGVTA